MWIKTSLLMAEGDSLEENSFFEIPIWINTSQIVTIRKIVKDTDVPDDLKRYSAISTTDGNTYYLKVQAENLLKMINPDNDGGISIENDTPPKPTLDTSI
jgi:hypothetical protein